ncbi:MAG: hypothetical protein K0R98_1075 [Rickettsiaceae bacterium]|jgi:hypothetical protein|nr:hypothetical protein [Rickettsiaceae bacterium]
MKTNPQEFKKLHGIWEGDGSEIKEQLIFSALLIMLFERFKKYIVDHVDGFFAESFDIINGNFFYTRGEKFKKLIIEKGKGKKGQHTNQSFRAALT